MMKIDVEKRHCEDGYLELKVSFEAQAALNLMSRRLTITVEDAERVPAEGDSDRWVGP